MNSYDWIVFDSTGTLMEPHPPAAQIYHELGQQFGDRQTLDQVKRRLREAIVRHFFQSGEDVPTDEAVELTRWRQIVADVLPEVRQDDFDDLFDQLWNRFASSRGWRLFDDSASVLQRLKAAGYQIAVASNFDRRLETIVDQLGIQPYFAATLISSQVGWSKPSQRFYDTATERLGMPPRHRILMIGDTLAGDVVAAEQAGWHARHLIREDEYSLDRLTGDL